ncbi:hypothetical protein AB0D74_43930 [Streptomyces sp. NPDC048278]|uniref:hypothetical protein n=1 Tax=Streptomyces sp. NPDC048278 TaxID=3155809 RepID=UPI0034167DC4
MSEQQSNEPLRVDTDLMRRAISRLEQLADQLISAGDQLQNASESYGECWGDDKTGKQFYEQYQEPHSQALTAAQQGGSVLHDSTEQVAAMVKAFESSEDNAAATGSSLSSGANDT